MIILFSDHYWNQLGSQKERTNLWEVKEGMPIESGTTDSLVESSSTNKCLQCPNCGRSYSCKQNLSKHLRLECGGRRSFSCHLCPTCFTQKGSLRRHLTNIHNIATGPLRNKYC